MLAWNVASAPGKGTEALPEAYSVCLCSLRQSYKRLVVYYLGQRYSYSSGTTKRPGNTEASRHNLYTKDNLFSGKHFVRLPGLSKIFWCILVSWIHVQSTLLPFDPFSWVFYLAEGGPACLVIQIYK